MASVERGPTIRRGTATSEITQTSTLASSTGLPQESNTTSFSSNSALTGTSTDTSGVPNTRAGITNGHDSSSGTSGLRGNTGISRAGNNISATPSYLEFGSQASGNNAFSIPTNPVYKTPGTTLPVPAGGGGGGLTKYFKMTGYYVTGAVYESFVVTGNPSPPTTTNPNTGHTLVNTFVSSFWEI